jgi:hypothetical protein
MKVLFLNRIRENIISHSQMREEVIITVNIDNIPDNQKKHGKRRFRCSKYC